MMRKMQCHRGRRLRVSGFTLFEVMVALPIAALLLFGTMDLFTTSTQMFARTNSAIDASMDSANSIQQVIDSTREAESYALPTENTFSLPSGMSLSGFSTTYEGETIDSAIELNLPPPATPSDVGYQAGNPTQISVKDSSGNDLAVTPVPYFHDGAPTESLLIYRGDPDQTPDPNPAGNTATGAGTYLWESTLVGGTVTSTVALCKSIATSANAVQFVRPTSDPSTDTGTPDPFQVEVKIVSSYYSPINGQQTSEETNGAAVSQLTGKCVYMRDHETTATTPSDASTKTVNNAFMFSH